MLAVLPFLILALLLQYVILMAFKARVVVTEDRITIVHGQSAAIIPTSALTSVTLTVHDGNRARIRFSYTRKEVPRFKTIGIGKGCDLERLNDLLPISIVTRDLRRERQIT